MRNLLTKQEHRWFHFIENLTDNEDWIILADLSALLDCSKRILKMDIVHLNESFDDFTIHTSNKGIKIKYNPNRSFKTFCQKLLTISDTYLLLEFVFLNENISAKNLSGHLDISLSTLYRIIDYLNEITEERFGFIIETGPCRIAGDEAMIRLFFYTYFFEKYPHHNWPFAEDDLDVMQGLVHEIIQIKKLPYDFIYFNIVKIIALVNYTRFKNNNTVSQKQNNNELILQLLNTGKINGVQEKTESVLDMAYNEEFIQQVLYPLLQVGIYQTQQEFSDAMPEDEELTYKTKALTEILTRISDKHNLFIPNLEMLLYAVYNAAFLETSQPQSKHILFNQNGFFTKQIKDKFPSFYKSIREGMEEYRLIMDKPITDTGINFYIFTVISLWETLVEQLYQENYKINVLVVSDRHQKHAQMMKEFIQFKFGKQLNIQTTNSIYMDNDIIDLSNYDLIISSYMDNRLNDYRSIYITDIPTPENLDLIQIHIDEIIESRFDLIK